MAEYLVGTYKASDFGIAVAMITQSGEFSASHDEAETPDENGNVLIYQQYNHRLEGSVTLKVPRGVAAPADGASLSVKCIEVPTYSAQGVPTGGYTLLSSPASTGVDYIVINPSLKTENTTVSEYSCTLRRYLENGVGSQDTDTSDSL